MQPSPQWHWDKPQGLTFVPGNANSDVLAATADGHDRFVREVVQNSMDAIAPEARAVEIVFREIRFSGEMVDRFATAMRLEEDGPLSKSEIKLRPDCSFRRAAKGQEFTAWLVEDYGTTGVTGRHEELNNGNWSAFLFALGGGHKEEGGGSFGFGKSVLSSLSDVSTFIVYTVTDTYERCIVAGMYNRFGGSESSSGYSGKAYLCIPTDNGWVLPLEGEQCRAFCREVGIPLRSEGAKGTSILVIGAELSAEGLVRSLETNWWPALVERKLSCVVQSWDGGERLPRPKQRADLKDYIRAHAIAIGTSDPTDSKLELRRSFNPHSLDTGPIDIGVLGVVARQEPPPEDESGSSTDVKPNRIALLRNPRLVVTYLGGICVRSAVQYSAVFVASPQADPVFRMAEPPSHDQWQSGESRLKDGFGDRGVDLVRNLSARLRNPIQDLLRPLRPEVPRSAGRLTTLDQMLRRFLRPNRDGAQNPPPGREADPFMLENSHRQDVGADGNVCHEFRVNIRLKPGHDGLTVIADPSAFALAHVEGTVDVSENLVDHVELLSGSERLVGRRIKFMATQIAKTVVVRTRPVPREWALEFALNLETS